MADYLEEWGPADRHLWDVEPANLHMLYPDNDEWRELQQAFDRGFIWNRGDDHHTRDEWDEIRQDYYNLSGTVPSSFDWKAYRDYLNAKGSPGL